MTRHDTPSSGSRNFTESFAGVTPWQSRQPRNVSARPYGGGVGDLDECDIVTVWRRWAPALAEEADRERRTQLHSLALDGYHAAWHLAVLVERVYEPRTGQKPVVAWLDRTPDALWHELGFWRRPTADEVRRHLIPSLTDPALRRGAARTAIARVRQMVADSEAQKKRLQHYEVPR